MGLQYFVVLKVCLKVSGKAVLQIITIDEQVFKDYINIKNKSASNKMTTTLYIHIQHALILKSS